MTKEERSLSKQGHLQPRCHSKARPGHRADNCKMVYFEKGVSTLIKSIKIKPIHTKTEKSENTTHTIITVMPCGVP